MLTRAALAATLILLLGHGASAKSLEIYFIDVEGGQSTLVVTPSGETLLIDAGYGGRGGRDPERILAAARDAHITRIDYLLITHLHPDHVGGVAELSARIPIGTFIDYGSPLGTPLGADMMVARSFPPYEHVRDDVHHLQPRPGDRLPLKGIDATVISAAGVLIDQPLPRAGEMNAACEPIDEQPHDGTENYGSIGVLLQFGDFTLLDPGDLSGDTLVQLFCPRNRVGRVSAYLIAHHGNYDSSFAAVYAALDPAVAIMNNGPTKGGAPEAFEALHKAGTNTDLWQLHTVRNARAANADADHVANIDDGSDGHWIRLTASRNGSFSVVNGRTGSRTVYKRSGGGTGTARAPLAGGTRE